jgi:ornithine carbamoyltransferase
MFLGDTLDSQTLTSKRDFLAVPDLSAKELRAILDLAKAVKKNPGAYSKSLAGRTLAMLFMKTSTRTRVSFEVAMYQLGGQAIFLDWRTTNFTLGGLDDEVKSLARYVDVIMARVFKHEDVEAMARASRVPVINGLSDMAHPCQALADMLTIEEKCPDTRNVKVVFIGDGTDNGCLSLIDICALLGVRLTVVCPAVYSPPTSKMAGLEKARLAKYITVTSDIDTGVKGADVLYTDTFVSMGQEGEAEKRLQVLKPYQLNAAVVQKSGKKPFIMHCLPAHKDVEIASELIDSPRSIIFDQAENRMHAQKALLLFLLGKV